MGAVLCTGLCCRARRGKIMGTETSVHNELAEIEGFVESDRRFGKEILG